MVRGSREDDMSMTDGSRRVTVGHGELEDTVHAFWI